MYEQKQLSLFVFIDALGWEILQHCAFLDDILTVRSPLDTIFGYSSTCDPTILTGKLPREHGHFSFFRYDPHASPFRACRFMKLLPHFVTRRGRVRRYLSRLIQWHHGYNVCPDAFPRRLDDLYGLMLLKACAPQEQGMETGIAWNRTSAD